MKVDGDAFSVQLTDAGVRMQRRLGVLLELDPRLNDNVLSKVQRLSEDTGLQPRQVAWVDIHRDLDELAQLVASKADATQRLEYLITEVHVRLELFRSLLIPPTTP